MATNSLNTEIKYNSKEEILKDINKYSDVLKFASDDLRNNKDIVLKSIKFNEFALRYASDELQNDKEFFKIVIDNLEPKQVEELLIFKNIKIDDLKDTKFDGNDEFILNLVYKKIIDFQDYKIENNIYFSETESYRNYEILNVKLYDYDGNPELGEIDENSALEEAHQHFNNDGIETDDQNYLIQNEHGRYYRTNFEEWFADLQAEYSRGKTELELRKKDLKLLFENEIYVDENGNEVINKDDAINDYNDYSKDESLDDILNQLNNMENIKLEVVKPSSNSNISNDDNSIEIDNIKKKSMKHRQ